MKEAILLFPGQGSQGVGMGLDLAEKFPAAATVFETADKVLGFPISAICFHGPDRELVLTHNAQPAVTAVNLAVLAVLKEAGITPLAVAGHSLGEYSANFAAGVFALDTVLRLTRRRGELMQECADECGGSMLAVIGLEMDKVEAICREVAAESGGVINIANFNSPTQVVITGEQAPLAVAARKAEAAGARRTVELKVSGPWHSALMEKAEIGFAKELAGIKFNDPEIPVYVNVDATRKYHGPELREALARQITSPVRWTQLIRRLRQDFPKAAFIECGPGRVLKGLLRAIDRDARGYAVEDSASLAALLEKI